MTDSPVDRDLAEMAGELLDGRTDLRSVARSTAYASHITNAIRRYDLWQAQLTAPERRQLEEEMRAILSDEDNRPDER